MQPAELTLAVLLGGATAPAAPSAARAIARARSTASERSSRCPTSPRTATDIFRDVLVFPQGTLHLVTTNLGFTFNLIPQSCCFTASVDQTGEIAGGTGPFTSASGSGAGGLVGHRTAPRAADGSCDPFAPTVHEVDRISSTGTLSY